jgi:hypothetical protein
MKMNKYQYVCENYKKPKPILFNTEMVQAILEGRKGQTRRPIDVDISNNFDCDPDGTVVAYMNPETGDMYDPLEIAPYKQGDILYVRETFYPCKHVIIDGEQQYLYRATFEQPEKYPDFKPKWKPSIHMPKEAARIFLRVTNVRVERLQDLLAIDVQKEGFEERGEFEDSWDDTYLEKGYGWDKNPWVWVIEFERVRENDD